LVSPEAGGFVSVFVSGFGSAFVSVFASDVDSVVAPLASAFPFASFFGLDDK
jgi:hypothetical protein